jgi:hypothetical protein
MSHAESVIYYNINNISKKFSMIDSIIQSVPKGGRDWHCQWQQSSEEFKAHNHRPRVGITNAPDFTQAISQLLPPFVSFQNHHSFDYAII